MWLVAGQKVEMDASYGGRSAFIPGERRAPRRAQN